MILFEKIYFLYISESAFLENQQKAVYHAWVECSYFAVLEALSEIYSPPGDSGTQSLHPRTQAGRLFPVLPEKIGSSQKPAAGVGLNAAPRFSAFALLYDKRRSS